MNGIEAAFSGIIGREPELRHVKDGTLSLLTFPVAVDGTKTADGKATWVRVAVFSKRADKLSGALNKLDKVYVEGALRLDEWTAKDGTARHGLSCAAFRVESLSRIGVRRPRQERNKPEASSPPPSSQPTSNAAPFDDDIPF